MLQRKEDLKNLNKLLGTVAKTGAAALRSVTTCRAVKPTTPPPKKTYQIGNRRRLGPGRESKRTNDLDAVRSVSQDNSYSGGYSAAQQPSMVIMIST